MCACDVTLRIFGCASTLTVANDKLYAVMQFAICERREFSSLAGLMNGAVRKPNTQRTFRVIELRRRVAVQSILSDF